MTEYLVALRTPDASDQKVIRIEGAGNNPPERAAKEAYDSSNLTGKVRARVFAFEAEFDLEIKEVVEVTRVQPTPEAVEPAGVL